MGFLSMFPSTVRLRQIEKVFLGRLGKHVPGGPPKRMMTETRSRRAWCPHLSCPSLKWQRWRVNQIHPTMGSGAPSLSRIRSVYQGQTRVGFDPLPHPSVIAMEYLGRRTSWENRLLVVVDCLISRRGPRGMYRTLTPNTHVKTKGINTGGRLHRHQATPSSHQ